jgi:hypothetical protein
MTAVAAASSKMQPKFAFWIAAGPAAESDWPGLSVCRSYESGMLLLLKKTKSYEKVPISSRAPLKSINEL